MTHHISIILVEPENSDNIGAAARAMKNMGLEDLRLVKPPRDWRAKAKKMAMSAYDVVHEAKAYASLKDAILDRQVVIGTTRRAGPKRGAFIHFDPALNKALEKSSALVFGKESKGLSNRDLALCDWVTTIPAHPAYPSLNLAQAVMVTAFTLFRNPRRKVSGLRPDPLTRFVTKNEITEVLGCIQQALRVLDYERKGGNVLERILATFKRLMGRNGLTASEAQMLRGLSRRIIEKNSLSAAGK